jgi:hypothetical protein
MSISHTRHAAPENAVQYGLGVGRSLIIPECNVIARCTVCMCVMHDVGEQSQYGVLNELMVKSLSFDATPKSTTRPLPTNVV